jgi:hypothetical protein
MSFAPDAEEDRTAGLGSLFAVPWRVTKVEPLENQRLYVTFVDGIAGIVDMSGLINSACPGVFSALRDKRVFDQAYLDHGAVTWPGELDIAPDAMYDEIKANGEWAVKGSEA